MRIVFYVSGHGYGHAVRDIEIIKSILKKAPRAEIHFRTGAPLWLFEPLLCERVRFHHRELDFGVKQKNSFGANKKATFERYAELLQLKDKLLEEEIQFLHSLAPDVILSDITPFAFDAAEAYGKKAVAVGNFSWDWIYSAFMDELPQFKFVVQDIKKSYSKAQRLFRIPFYGDMSAFANIENVPLIGRRAKMPASEVRRRIGIPRNDGKKYVLLGLRMDDLKDVEFDQMETMNGLCFVAVSRDVNVPNCLHIKEGQPPFEELLNACDAVLSKPGYSMVAEVIINHTPIVYVPRQDFVEDPPLIAGLQRYAVSERLSQDDYFAGNWHGAFQRLFAKPGTRPYIQSNGADVIADRILADAG